MGIDYSVWAAAPVEAESALSKMITREGFNPFTNETTSFESVDPSGLDVWAFCELGRLKWVDEFHGQLPLREEDLACVYSGERGVWNIWRLPDEEQATLLEELKRHHGSDPEVLDFIARAEGRNLFLADDSM